MAYSDIDKSDAFVLFCSGHSFHRIAEIMRVRPNCASISPNTIKSWSEQPDDKGRTWIDRKSEVDALVEVNENTTAARIKTNLVGEIEAVQAKVLEEITDGSLKFKTKDAAIYSFKSLGEWCDKIKERNKRIGVENQVQIMFESMNEIPEVKEVLSKHWKPIMNIFEYKAREILKAKNG